jgi:hypothetical protein
MLLLFLLHLVPFALALPDSHCVKAVAHVDSLLVVQVVLPPLDFILSLPL